MQKQEQSQPPVITIDGPSGVGKGTTAKRVAAMLGWHFLDSGALYRILAYACQIRSVDLDNTPAVLDVANTMDVSFDFRVDDAGSVLLDGAAVADSIRNESVARGASVIASNQAVRDALLQRQRDFRQSPGLVADGRDMGTVVFTDAACKIFLTASAEERAKRRYNQLKDNGKGVSLRALLTEISARDERDASRKVAPLVPAEDAVIIDTTELSVEDVLRQVMQEARIRIDSIRGDSQEMPAVDE